MKHNLKITGLLIGMFLIAQLIGIFVIHAYQPEIKQVVDENGTVTNVTAYNLPYGMAPPEEINPGISLISILIAFVIAIVLMLVLMRIRAEFFLRAWFFFVVSVAIAITLNSFIIGATYSSIIALIVAVPLAFLKIFKRNIIVHNVTELVIYPGIAAIFVPIVNTVWVVVVLLILISIYDIYAVWHAGFMQKMAKYQIKKLRFFAGFFVPYLGKKEREIIREAKRSKGTMGGDAKGKKIKVSVAILGGGDVVFPIILAGVVLNVFGLLSAIIISLGATVALTCLFYLSEKGKFYPAMPFISAGCFVALGIVYLIKLI